LDFAFKKYADICSCADLMLYRGLVLEVRRLSSACAACGKRGAGPDLLI
jgi:hypothetical protein